MMARKKTGRRRVDGAQDAALSIIRVGRKTEPSPNVSIGNSLTEANPRISFGRYRILSWPGHCELWSGTWQEGYSKIADVSIKDGIISLENVRLKIPKVILRKLQEQYDGTRRQGSDDWKAGSFHEQQGMVQLRKSARKPSR